MCLSDWRPQERKKYIHKVIVLFMDLEGFYRERMGRIVPNSTQDWIQGHERKYPIWIEEFLNVSNLKGIDEMC